MNAAPLASEPLAGVRVVELGELVTAPWASRYLALMGAEVIKVEPLVGDGSRRRGPFPGDVPDPDASGMYQYLNVEKRGVTLNFEHPEAATVLRALLGDADILIENLGQPRLGELGMGFEDIRDVNDDLIVCAITAFGLDGPRSGDQATDLGVFHAGGEGSILPGGLGWQLYSDREPLRSPAFTAHYDAGTTAAIALLMTFLGRELGNASGAGAELIDLSEQEALMGLNRLEMQRFPTRGFEETRATRALPVGDIVQAADGFLCIDPLSADMWKGLCRAMGREDLVDDERYADWAAIVENGAEANAMIHEWAIKHPKEFVYHAAQSHGCAAGLVRTPEDLLAAEQLRVHGFFGRLEGTDIDLPVLPFRLSDTTAIEPNPDRELKRAPRLGQHNAEVYGEALGWSAGNLAWQRNAGLI